MNISLRPDLERFVESQLKAGRFGSVEEVIEAAIVRFASRDETSALEPAELESLRAQIAVGIDQLDRGEGVPWDIDSIRKEGQRLLNSGDEESR